MLPCAKRKRWYFFVNASSCILSLSALETHLLFAYAAYRKHNIRKLICSSFYKLPKLSKSMSKQFYTETSAPVKHCKHASSCLLFCISDKMSTQRVECRTSDEQQRRLRVRDTHAIYQRQKNVLIYLR